MEYSVAIPSIFIFPSFSMDGEWLQAFSTVPLVLLAFAVSFVLTSLVLRHRNASHLVTCG